MSDAKLRGILRSDRFLDFVLDELTEAAGLRRGTDALGLARWDLKAALEHGVAREEDKQRAQGRQRSGRLGDRRPGGERKYSVEPDTPEAVSADDLRDAIG